RVMGPVACQRGLRTWTLKRCAAATRRGAFFAARAAFGGCARAGASGPPAKRAAATAATANQWVRGGMGVIRVVRPPAAGRRRHLGAPGGRPVKPGSDVRAKITPARGRVNKKARPPVPPGCSSGFWWSGGLVPEVAPEAAVDEAAQAGCPLGPPHPQSGARLLEPPADHLLARPLDQTAAVPAPRHTPPRVVQVA